MDLQVSVFLLLALFTTGYALNCYECTGPACAAQKEKTCPSGLSKCKTFTTLIKAGGRSSTVRGKECTEDCASGSLNLGTIKTSFECCNTDLCNNRYAPDPSTNAPNGKSCYVCDEKSCSNVVSCLGGEDRCVDATQRFGTQSLSIKGCASKSICESTASTSIFPGFSCCEGNLCNRAVSVSQSFMFLCFSLLSFTLMH